MVRERKGGGWTGMLLSWFREADASVERLAAGEGEGAKEGRRRATTSELAKVIKFQRGRGGEEHLTSPPTPPPHPTRVREIKIYKLKLIQQPYTPPLPHPSPHTHTGEGTRKQRGRLQGYSHQPRRISPAWPGLRVSRARQPRNAKGGGFSWLPAPRSFLSPPITRSRLPHPLRPWAKGLAPPASSPRPLLSAS